MTIFKLRQHAAYLDRLANQNACYKKVALECGLTEHNTIKLNGVTKKFVHYVHTRNDNVTSVRFTKLLSVISEQCAMSRFIVSRTRDQTIFTVMRFW